MGILNLHFSEFPYREVAITVGGTVRPRPGTDLLFHFDVPRGQKHYSFKFLYMYIYIDLYIYIYIYVRERDNLSNFCPILMKFGLKVKSRINLNEFANQHDRTLGTGLYGGFYGVKIGFSHF